ncbi:hypothetical protein BDN67DRAFT_1070877 [Paxillus ammoniavirescens]|nr:hypothetical protein BDN67DRAFT_1070877 [Paxillus ammoniavirescens]
MEPRLLCSLPSSSCSKCGPVLSSLPFVSRGPLNLSTLENHWKQSIVVVSGTDLFSHHDANNSLEKEESLESKLLDNTWQGLGSRSNTTSHSNENEKCESPDGTLPPSSSSPPCIMADSSPTDKVLSQLDHIVGPPVLFGRRGVSITRTAPNDLGLVNDSNAHITSIRRSLIFGSKPHDRSAQPMGTTSNILSDMAKDGSSESSRVALMKSPNAQTLVVDGGAVGHAQDICADRRITDTPQSPVGQDGEQGCVLEPPFDADCGSPTPVARQKNAKVALSAVVIVDSSIPLQFHSSSNCQTPRGVTPGDLNGQAIPSRMLSPESIELVPSPSPAGHISSLKRRRSTIEDTGYPPPHKKAKLDRKISRNPSDASSPKLDYSAKEPASIRRAQSLKTEGSKNLSTDVHFSPCSLDTPTFHDRRSDEKDFSFPPTAPSSPLPDSVEYARSKANPLSRTVAVHGSSPSSTVPIIAPSPHVPPTIVQSAEDYAVGRLELLLLRERSERERDRLSTYDAKRAERCKSVSANGPPTKPSGSSSSSDSSNDCDRWEEESTRSASQSSGSQDTTPNPITFSALHRRSNRDAWTRALGIGNEFRKHVTGWILDVLPEPGNHRRFESRHGNDLFDQLSNSPHTPFHAVHIFHRYCLLAVGPDSQCEPSQIHTEGTNGIDETADMTDELGEDSSGACERVTSVVPRKLVNQGDWNGAKEGWETVIWDLVIGCLALSVKLHRDCLAPLCFIFADEFLELASHAMYYEDLERSQRDILHALQFTLGSCTPQDVLDELWNALPTLRKAIAPIPDGWTAIQRKVWEKLFEAVLEPDMLQYPISLLTAAVLVDTLVFSLARQYKSEAESKSSSSCKCRFSPSPQIPERIPPNDIRPTSWQIYIHEATEVVENVVLDVKDVLHISDLELEECQMWLSYVGQE